MKFLLLAIIFLILVLCFFWLIIKKGNKKKLKDRLKPYVGILFTSLEPTVKQGYPKERFSTKLTTKLINFIFFKGYQAHIKDKLAKAGVLLRPSEFILIDIFVTLCLAIIGVLLFSKLFFIGLVIGGGLGYFIPHIFLHHLKKKRLSAFTRQLCNALSLISNSLKAGYSFLQALDMVAKETFPPVSVEFSRVIREENLGVPLEKALGNLTNRIESDDLDLVITAVLIQRQIGGNLSEILDRIAWTVRERIRIKGEIKTLTAQGRLSGCIISLLPIILGVILYFLQPDIYKLLLTEHVGWGIIGICIIMQATGILIIRKIIQVEV
ncbi:MAG: type II secretion system F family protein [bacterium]|nr:type II secretion system F family protein [bacterium]